MFIFKKKKKVKTPRASPKRLSIQERMKIAKCDGKCGIRPNKDTPWSTQLMKNVYRNMGYKVSGKEYKKKIADISEREFFCEELQNNPEFCRILRNTNFNEKIGIIKKVKEVGTLSKENSIDKYNEEIKRKYKQFKWKQPPIKNKCQGGGSKKRSKKREIKFTKTQQFVMRYFTPRFPFKGILLNHSVGTGKSCTAIVTASNEFEKKDWTIIWVTRGTLKSVMWKNITEDVCHLGVINKKRSTGKYDSDEKIKKIVSKHWLPPVSYKTFSNAMNGKILANGEIKGNDLFQRLVKRNGKTDPLRKTLIIIDEVHNLFAGDLKPQEEPTVSYIQSAIQKSYRVSGEKSAKVLLLTATPIVNKAMDLIHTLNLILEKHNQFPSSYKEFKEEYLDDNGEFTEEGKHKFQDKIKGMISVLDRSTDPTNFTQVVKTKIYADISSKPLINSKVEQNEIKSKLKSRLEICKMQKSKSDKEKCKTKAKSEANLEKEKLRKKIQESKTLFTQTDALRDNCKLNV